MATPTTPTPTPRKKPALMRIKDITPALADSECSIKAIVLESNAKDDANPSSNATLVVSDETASISLVVPKPIAQHVRVSDIIHVQQTQVVLKNQRVYLWGGRIERVGEFVLLFKDAHNVTNITWVPDPANPDVMIPGRSPAKRPKPSRP